MSDDESYFEDEIDNDRELIIVVQANKFLYDKTEKLYANSQVKAEAWTRIGASLTHPLEGPAAEKRFYALRQRFGKEHRKVIQSMPRSGAAADELTYKPAWVLYKDLTFLKDIIKPRETSSNYKSKIPSNQVSILRSSSTFPFSAANQVTVRTISPFSSTSATASPDMSSCWNSDLTNLADIDGNATDASETYTFSASPITLPSTTSPPAVLPSVISATPPSAVTSKSEKTQVAQVQRAMSNIGIKRKVPPADSFANKKRQETDTFNKSLLEQSKGLTDLATKIGQAIIAPPLPLNAPSADVSNTSDTQPMLSAIGFALSVVPNMLNLSAL